MTLFRVIADYGSTWQVLNVRARSAEESFDEAIGSLERDGVAYGKIRGMRAAPVEEEESWPAG